MELLGLASLSERLPETLSGGEKQRVALARALISSPKVLLLDEPFSSLDFRTARHLRLELKRIQARVDTTMLFVTHNLEEAQDLGDRMGVMSVRVNWNRVGGIDDIMLQGRPSQCGFLEKPNVLGCVYEGSLGNGLVHVKMGRQTPLCARRRWKTVQPGGHSSKRCLCFPLSAAGPPGKPVSGPYRKNRAQRGAWPMWK